MGWRRLRGRKSGGGIGTKTFCGCACYDDYSCGGEVSLSFGSQKS